MCSGEAWTDWYILACTKGELNQKLQHVLRGAWTVECTSKKTIFMYWCSLIPIRRLLLAEGYNLLSFSRLSWKGATTPLALVLAELLVRRC